MAKVKAGSNTKLGRDSNPSYLGIKKSDGQSVKSGQIIVRQRGSKWKSGNNTKRTKDDTIIALKTGIVKYKKTTFPSFTGKRRKGTIVFVV